MYEEVNVHFGTQLCGPRRWRNVEELRPLRFFPPTVPIKKILSTPSFGGEVNLLVPCRRFAARKRFLNGMEVVISAKLPDNFLAHSSTFRR